MKRPLLCSTVLVAALGASAQTVYIPPDYFNENYSRTIGFWKNDGQIADTQGDSVPDVKFYSEGGTPRAYLQKHSKVSFVIAHVDTSLATTDTLYRLDMQPFGPRAHQTAPVAAVVKDWYQNFYLPQCGDSGVTHVQGYSRVLYQDIFPNIDMHFYSGSAGQKMAFVMRPGSDPSELKLAFEGQDSIKVDFLRALRIYYDGKYMQMPFAQAYQVGANDTILPLNWVPTYHALNGVVSFDFSSYNDTLPLVFQVGPPPAAGGTDPLDNLCWSTYLGGTNSDQVTTSALDAAGNYFVTGSTSSDFNTIPNNPGTTTINGGYLTLLARFHDDYHLDWLTYYGATGGGEAIAVREGPPERVYVGGSTYNNNLFTFSEAGAYNLQSVSSGDYSRAFIAKFDLTGALYWSTYFGNGESEITGMDVDGGGRLHITGYSNNQGLPVTSLAGATSWPFTGTTTNTIIARFTPADTINWCTPYNGEVNTLVTGGVGSIKCFAGGFYVSTLAAGTSPTIDLGGVAYYDSTNEGGQDCLLMRFNTAAHCDHATKFGGNGDDFPGWNSLTVNKDGDLYFVGRSASTSGFPLVNDGGTCDSINGGHDGFIAMVHHGDLALTWSSFVNAPLSASCLDDQGHVFAVGTTIENAPGTFPVIDFAPYYNQSTWNGDGDGVVIGYELGQAGDHLQYYGTYYGGDEGGVTHDQITTTAWGGQRLYLSGITAKGQDVTTFFPLVNPGLPAYFDGTYQFVPNAGGLNQNISDAFVASICTGTVGIEEVARKANATFAMGALEGDGRSLFGLPDGQVQLRVFDATGRLVTTETVVCAAGRAHMPVREQAPGVYVVQAVAGGYRAIARFVSTR